MRVSIQSVHAIDITRYEVQVRIGAIIMDFHIIESDDGGLLGFNIEEPLVEALFSFNGIGARFNRDYWSYRNKGIPSFPWDYGEHDENIVEKAEKMSGTRLNLFQ